MRETKAFKFSVKAVDDKQGLIEAYGSVFDNVDQGDDVVRKGAFKRTIQNAKSRVRSQKAKYLAPILYQHNPDQPIGGWYDLSEDTNGLLCKGQLVLTTQLGHDVYELIKAGVLNEFSIGYDIPTGGSRLTKDGTRELTELRLWEISVVTFAMNQEAVLVGVKHNRLSKTGRAISADNAELIKAHVDRVHDLANSAMAALRKHTKDLHDAADDLATVLQGSEGAYGSDTGTPASGQDEGKRASRIARASNQFSANATIDEEELEKALANIRSLRSEINL